MTSARVSAIVLSAVAKRNVGPDIGPPTSGMVPDPGPTKLLPLMSKDVAPKLALLAHRVGAWVKSV